MLKEMENMVQIGEKDDQITLPPGFRFHPTDEELITHYLSKKVNDGRFVAIAVGEADLNKSEPWELPWKAKIGEKEWYFFVLRDKKYPTGLRTNRATHAGYWKATGKDKEIYRGKYLVGMKKTLVFYKGRAPKGEKSNWVMHEYRLEGKLSLQNLAQNAKTEWVICRVFQKSSGGKKMHISGLTNMNSYINNNEMNSIPSDFLPPLMDSSPSKSAYVPCFSNPIMNNNNNNNNLQKVQEEFPNYFNNNNFSNPPPNNQYYVSPVSTSNLQQNSFMMVQQDPILRSLMFDHHRHQNTGGSNYMDNMIRQHFKTEKDMISVSQETGLTNDNMNQEISSLMAFDHDQEDPCSSVAPAVDPDCFWGGY